jgi:alpha-beta hydrolase superfamily lysophospholipase
MGSAAILHAFHKAPLPVAGVILGCPFDDFYHTVENRFSILGLPAFPLAHFLMFWGNRQLGFNAYSFKPMEDAVFVHCPALLLYGAQDRNVLPDQSRSVFMNLGGPKESEVFLDCGHESFYSKDPGQWKEAVFGFLDQNPGSQALQERQP